MTERMSPVDILGERTTRVSQLHLKQSFIHQNHKAGGGKS